MRKGSCYVFLTIYSYYNAAYTSVLAHSGNKSNGAWRYPRRG